MYFKKTSIVIALLLIAAGGIYYYSNNTDSTSEVNQRQGPYVDSLAPDNRPSFTARRDTVPQPAGENLAPGTALLRTTILNSDEAAMLKVRVEEILGYGSSTPPISSGTEFEFDVTHYLEQNPELKDKIKEESEINMIVSSQEGVRIDGSDNNQEWSFVRIEPK